MFGWKEHSLLLGAAQEPREKRAFPGSPAVAAPGLRLCRQADADIVVSGVGAGRSCSACSYGGKPQTTARAPARCGLPEDQPGAPDHTSLPLQTAIPPVHVPRTSLSGKSIALGSPRLPIPPGAGKAVVGPGRHQIPSQQAPARGRPGAQALTAQALCRLLFLLPSERKPVPRPQPSPRAWKPPWGQGARAQAARQEPWGGQRGLWRPVVAQILLCSPGALRPVLDVPSQGGTWGRWVFVE